MLGNYHFWLPVAYLVVLLVLIDGTESLATIAAVDKLDPYRRRSDPDRTLLAMGVSNMCSSTVGGLTIIPGIVKSTANIMGGGRTQWANFFNACFLLTLLIFGRNLINLVPKTVLAAILVFIGFKLCRPKVWVKVGAHRDRAVARLHRHRSGHGVDRPAHRHLRRHRHGAGDPHVVPGPVEQPAGWWFLGGRPPRV